MGSGGALWTPNGMVSTREKSVEAVTREEIIIFSKFHEMAQRLRISVVCPRCDKPFLGQNNDTSPVLSVACGCRELRYTRDGR